MSPTRFRILLRTAATVAAPLLRDAAFSAIQQWATRRLATHNRPADPPWPEDTGGAVEIAANHAVDGADGAAPCPVTAPYGSLRLVNPSLVSGQDPGGSVSLGTGTLAVRMAHPDNLRRAWLKVAARKGTGAGVDGETAATVRDRIDPLLASLGREITAGEYKPLPLLCYDRRKPGGGVRRVAVPALRDRIAQRAMAQTLDLIVEPGLSRWSFAYRSERGCHEALAEADALMAQGKPWIVRADIRNCFDSIPHGRLLDGLPEPIAADAGVRSMIRAIIAGPRIVGWRVEFPKAGVPQGSPISPLLANLYLDPVDRAARAAGLAMIRYADDLLCACGSREEAGRFVEVLEAELRARGLALNAAKSRIADSRTDAYEFLGHRYESGGWSPAPGRVEQIQRAIGTRLQQVREPAAERVAAASRKLEGWLAYYGRRTGVGERLRGWFRARPEVKSR